jgi:hypothetical protein
MTGLVHSAAIARRGLIRRRSPNGDADRSEQQRTQDRSPAFDAGAPHYNKAHDVIDALIDPRSGVFLIEEHGYGHSNMKAFEAVEENALVARGLSKNPLDLIQAGVFIPNAGADITTKIETDWNEIRSGF